MPFLCMCCKRTLYREPCLCSISVLHSFDSLQILRDISWFYFHCQGCFAGCLSQLWSQPLMGFVYLQFCFLHLFSGCSFYLNLSLLFLLLPFCKCWNANDSKNLRLVLSPGADQPRNVREQMTRLSCRARSRTYFVRKPTSIIL